MISFPRLSGVTARLVIANAAIFFLLLLMRYAAPQWAAAASSHFSLVPALLVRGWVWQLVTYSFISFGVWNVAFNMLTLWFIGSFLESSKGGRWLLEAYFLSAAGGALLGSALCFTHVFGSTPFAIVGGADAAIVGLLAAFAVLFGDLEMMMFPLPVGIKARYLVVVIVLIDLAFMISGGNPLAYFTVLSGALVGFLYARRAPRRRGRGFSFGDQIQGLRNSYYRWKRRQAARKFEVYMRKQNREVRFDDEGRYIAPDERHDPNDRKWMN